MRRVLEEFGVQADREAPEWTIGPSIHEIYARVLKTNCRETIQRGIDCFRAHYAGIGLELTRLFPGVEEMLRRLKSQGRHLAIASLKSEKFVRAILDRHDLTACFDQVHGTPLDNPEADKATMIREIIAGWPAASAQDVVMIGDTASDIEAASACGARSIGALYGYGNSGQLLSAGPTAACRSVSELAILLGVEASKQVEAGEAD